MPSFLLFTVGRAAPAVNAGTPQRTEYPVLESVVGALHLVDEILGALTVGGSVHGTFRLHDRKPGTVHAAPYLVFRREDQRTYHGDVLAVEVGHRREAPDTPLREEVHDERLEDILVVMSERDLVATELLRGIVERTAPHSRAETARVVLPADIENYLPDVGRNDAVFYT